MPEATDSIFDRFTSDSAAEFLQTVVLVDDRIYDQKSGGIGDRSGRVAKKVTRPRAAQRKRAVKKPPSPGGDVGGLPDAREEVSFHDVQNSYAKRGIICALYQPTREAKYSTASNAYKLCVAADVVVVDWDLYGDGGTGATELIGVLIEQSVKEIPHQLRLVLIYTLDPNLRAVADTIYESLSGRLGENLVTPEEPKVGLVLTTSNSRVVILGKRPNEAHPEYSEFVVPEEDLAERTIAEFGKLASGLLQGIVLRGIASLRKNNRRILTRFHKDLDVAFLIHRALLLPDDDAFGQVTSLLTDELRATLEDSWTASPFGSLDVREVVADWCDRHWNANPGADLEIGEGQDAVEFAKDVICNGPANAGQYTKRGSKIKGLVETDNGSSKWKSSGEHYNKLAMYLVGVGTKDCLERLGSLMMQSGKYSGAKRALQLGVVVKELFGDERFLLCLQPYCDSVRLGGRERVFMFCALSEANDGEPFSHCLSDVKGNIMRLRYKPTVFNLVVHNFKGSVETVNAKCDSEGRYTFRGKKGKRYEWIGELKADHAQRAAEQFGRELSRVGLTESEWLRRKAKK